MKTLHYGKYSIDVPSEFNELTGSQLVKLMNIIQHRDDELAAQVAALKVVSNKNAVRFYMLPPDAVAAFTEHIQFLFEANTLTAQLLPKYDGMYGPNKELGNLRMKEFHFTEQYYQEFVADATKEEFLNKLVAVLYRPAKLGYDIKADKEGDVREAFQPHNTDRYASRIAEWPLAVRLAILFYYDGCRQFIISLYDEVFSGKGEGEEESPYGMYALMMELAGEKLGTVDKVEDLYVHTALASLEIMLKKAEQIENANPSST